MYPHQAAPPRLPVPAAWLFLAGAAPARTEVPGWVPRCLRRGPFVVLLQILHILGLLDGDTDLHCGLRPGQSLVADLGHGWQGPRAARPGQPGRRDSDDRAWAARAPLRLGPGEGLGSRSSPRRTAGTALSARAGTTPRAPQACPGVNPRPSSLPASLSGGAPAPQLPPPCRAHRQRSAGFCLWTGLVETGASQQLPGLSPLTDPPR